MRFDPSSYGFRRAAARLLATFVAASLFCGAALPLLAGPFNNLGATFTGDGSSDVTGVAGLGGTFAVVVNEGENTVQTFEIDVITGELIKAPKFTVSTGGASSHVFGAGDLLNFATAGTSSINPFQLGLGGKILLGDPFEVPDGCSPINDAWGSGPHNFSVGDGQFCTFNWNLNTGEINHADTFTRPGSNPVAGAAGLRTSFVGYDDGDLLALSLNPGGNLALEDSLSLPGDQIPFNIEVHDSGTVNTVAIATQSTDPEEPDQVYLTNWDSQNGFGDVDRVGTTLTDVSDMGFNPGGDTLHVTGLHRFFQASDDPTGSLFLSTTDEAIDTEGRIRHEPTWNSNRDWTSRWTAGNEPHSINVVEGFSDLIFATDQENNTLSAFSFDADEASIIPEPSSFALMTLGGLFLLGYGCRRRRRRKHPIEE